LKKITITEAELKNMMQQASHDGAKIALKEVGLGDDTAPTDIRDLRAVLDAWRTVKTEAIRSVTQMAIKGFLILILVAVAVKTGFHFGGD
jgi:hypothetical protein